MDYDILITTRRRCFDLLESSKGDRVARGTA